MRSGILIIIAMLCACQGEQPDSLAAETAAPPQAELQQPPLPSAEPVRAVQQDAEPPLKPQSVDLCWQDYCPCDQPETALDRTICRNARGGIEMSDDQWSIGAMARDLKHAGDESNRQMDEVMRDAQAQRSRLSGAQPAEETLEGGGE